MPEFLYNEIGLEAIDVVKPLWEKLNAHHSRLSQRFETELKQRTFEPRKRELLAKAKSGKLRIDLVHLALSKPPLAYCISSISADGIGEIDSIFVEENFRGGGVGLELMRRALAWLDEFGTTSKIVSVAHGNNEAVAFYSRFGFFPRTIVLRRIPENAK